MLLPTGPLKPDFQGNWTNGTTTLLERLWAEHEALSAEEAAGYERHARRPWQGELFYDPGLELLKINGVTRSSILVDPPNGRVPPLTDAGKRRVEALKARKTQYGELDHPEMRSLGERCLISFGSNAGPPMLPNYFYNNNYTIVQTKDHLLILTEQNHDARIIRLGTSTHVPTHIQPWFGVSIGRWEGASLVIETTNIHPAQVDQLETLWAYRGASTNLKVTERMTLIEPNAILYRFTLSDPEIFSAPFGGELLFRRTDEPVFEYACHEGNYSIANMLSMARDQERKTGAHAAKAP